MSKRALHSKLHGTVVKTIMQKPLLAHLRRCPRLASALLTAIFISTMLPHRARAEEGSSPASSSTAPASAAPVPTKAAEGAATKAMTAAGVDPPGTGSAPSATLDGAEGSGIGNVAMAGAEPSTGVAHASIPFQLPRARGDVQPQLGLHYASTAGLGDAGFGWSLGPLPRIERHNPSNGPRYNDPAPGVPLDPKVADRFEFMGQPLVPICLVMLGKCTNGAQLQPGEEFPVWAGAGWMYFRSQVEGSFTRFFWSADHRRWIAQGKGWEIELGVPFHEETNDGAVDLDTNANPTDPPVYRWNIVRQRDLNGSYGNVIVYDWKKFPAPDGWITDGLGHLTDIYYSSSEHGDSPSRASFAHHTRLTYKPARPEFYPSHPFSPDVVVWRRIPRWLLSTVDVTSADFQGSANRSLVRQYELFYTWRAFHSQARFMLGGVQMHGACPAAREDSAGAMPKPLPCKSERLVAGLDYWGYGIPSVSPPMMTLSIGQATDKPQVLMDLDGDGIAELLAYSNKGDGLVVGTRFGSPNRPATQKMVIYPSDVLYGDREKQLLFNNAMLGDWLHTGGMNAIATKFDSIEQCGDPIYATFSPTYESNSRTWGWGMSDVRRLRLQDWMDGWQCTDPNKYQFAPSSLFADLDGDGYEDRLSFTPISRPSGDPPNGPEILIGNNRSVFLTQVDKNDRAIDPFGMHTPRIEDESAKRLIEDQYHPRGGYLIDLTGDGIPDLVRHFVDQDPSKTRPHDKYPLYYGKGDGSFQFVSEDAGRPLRFDDKVREYLHDVNGDSIADLVVIEDDRLPHPKRHLWVAFGDGFGGYDKSPIDIDLAAADIFFGPLQFADLNGSGIDSIIIQSGAMHAISLTGPNGPPEGQTPNEEPRPGLLKSITNGVGATTTLEYNTIQSVTYEIAGHRLAAPVPQPLHIVTRVTTSSSADVKSAGGPYVTEYEYKDAVYDKKERRFRGFREVNTKQHGPTADDDVRTYTTFLIADCPKIGGNWCSGGDSIEAINGLPVLVSHYGATPSVPYLTHYRYRLKQLYAGMDGRTVRTAYAERIDTWYDDLSGGGDPTTVEVEDIVSDALPDKPPTRTVKPRHYSNGARVHIASEVQKDGFGNVTSTTNYGMVDAGPENPKDVPIVRTFENWVLPPGDASRWNWRALDSRIGGRHTHFDYDAAGHVTKAYADLQGTLDLVRFHEDSSKDTAKPPADISRDKANLLTSQVDYDTWGNPIVIHGPNGRCRRVDYDASYHQLPTATTIYRNGCGGTGLATTAAFDRGLEVITATTDPSGAVTSVDHDEFGRPVAVFEPDPGLTGLVASQPSVKMTYSDPVFGGSPYRVVRTERRDDDGSAPRYRSSWTYVDPFGHTVASMGEADTAAGDQGPFIVSGEVERDVLGRVVKRYEPRFSTLAPGWSPPVPVPSAPATTIAYDSVFSGTLPAIRTYGRDGQFIGKVEPRALSQMTYDAMDLAQGATPHPTKTIRDGFGRTTLTQRTTNQNGAPDTIATSMTYLPTGEVATVSRSHTASNDVYTRMMTYDSFGRLVQNAEPNTSKDFDTAGMKAWRYAYNDAGDLVGTSDARGCGKNMAYDGIGRLLSETYSPCLRSQANYDEHPASTFIYDAPEDGQDGNATFFLGRLAATYDRAQRTRYTYDGRGRVMQVARQIALVQQAGVFVEESMDLVGAAPEDVSALQAGYAAHWYKTAFVYDEADRVMAQSMGMDVPEMQGAAVTVGKLTGNDVVTTSYTARGIANRVGGSYGDLINGKVADADGLVRSITYGDTAGTVATYDYNARRLLQRSLIQRTPPDIWNKSQDKYSKPSKSETAQTVLEDLRLDAPDSYDAVGNPLKVVDARIADEWPAGAKPIATKQFTYDDLYQLRRVEYGTGDDVQVSPFAYEASNDDTRPIPAQKLEKRAKWQSFDFDWHGNLTKSDDDVHAFHDRSMGAMVYGTPSNGPNRVASASGEKGNAQATYDAAGNLTGLKVHKPAPDPDDGAMDLAFSYEWDEVGRLVRAKRKPVSGVAMGVEFRYAYTAGGQRVIKSVEDPRVHERVYSIEVFPTMRLNGARFRSNDYERNEDTAAAYLVSGGTAIARVVHGDRNLPTIGEKKARVYFTMTDPLGSTSIVVDKSTSELVERSTYLAYGQAETDYRPTRWQSFREDYRFTGKEDDVGVGLTYFGARYYVAALGQWASADPLTVHGLGADLNPYAYVSGSPQRKVDPTGLNECTICYDNGNGAGGLMGWDPFGSATGDSAKPFFTRVDGIQGYLVAKVPTGVEEADPSGLVGFRIREYIYTWSVSVPNEDCPPGEACMDTVGVRGEIVDELEPLYDVERNGSGYVGWQDAGRGKMENRERSAAMWEAQKYEREHDLSKEENWMRALNQMPLGGGTVRWAAEEVATRALSYADLGLSGNGIEEIVGTVTNAGSTRVIDVEMIKAVEGSLLPELRGAMGNIVNTARAEGVQTLQISGSFGNPRLSAFAASQTAKYGGTFSSVGGRETMTFIFGVP